MKFIRIFLEYWFFQVILDIFSSFEQFDNGSILHIAQWQNLYSALLDISSMIRSYLPVKLKDNKMVLYHYQVVSHSISPEWKEGFKWAFEVPPKGQKLHIICKSKNTFGKVIRFHWPSLSSGWATHSHCCHLCSPPYYWKSKRNIL